ncbi:maturation of Asn-linked oligosaccharides protein [Puccinia graminis f. sp. tritici]|nr:maturation of Asn-linked oligosaccharides protein [Puccinia graminis f. sp. tritici]
MPLTKKPRSAELEFFDKNGFYIGIESYDLRPEVVESAFYAWRLTGDTRYQDFVWEAFKSLQKHCKAPASFAAISDVNSLPAKLIDDSESFLYAELFKYIYLTFSDPNLLSLDEYVFTTEAHPLRITKEAIV